MLSEYKNSIRYVPGESIVGYNIHEKGFIYPLEMAAFLQRSTYVPYYVDRTCYEIAIVMKARSTRYLVVAPEYMEEEKIGHLENFACEVGTMLLLGGMVVSRIWYARRKFLNSQFRSIALNLDFGRMSVPLGPTWDRIFRRMGYL
jgi:hypothetical protein